MEMVANRLEAWKQRLFHEPGVMSKNYETEDNKKTAEECQKLEANRFEGYQKLCLAGLGTMFWGTAASLLPHLEKRLLSEEKMIPWVHYTLSHWISNSSIYATVALVLLLLGLCASTFPSSSLQPVFMAGLGGWQAFVFILGTFHVASLKYYSSMEECFFCFLGASVTATVYWGFSAQDPVILHVFLKMILWVICFALFAVCFLLYHLVHLIMWLLSGLVGGLWWCLVTCLGSSCNALSALYHLARGYQLPAGQGQMQQP